MDWDDYRFFRAVAQQGSVRGAAAELGVNPSTVTRRLDQLEARLGVALFVRSAQGLRVTPEAAEVVAALNDVAGRLEQVQATLKGRDERLAGRVTVAVPDILASEFLLADLAPFIDAYPDIDLVLVPGYQNLDVASGRIDVAIRVTQSPPEHLVGRRMTPIALAAYGAAAVLKRNNVGGVLDWIGWADSGEVMTQYHQLQQTYFPQATVRLRCDHVKMHQSAILAGLGAGILPCFIADGDERLVRLPQMPVQASPMLWMLSNPDQRGVRRVQVLMEALREIFAQRAMGLYEGFMTGGTGGEA